MSARRSLLFKTLVRGVAFFPSFPSSRCSRYSSFNPTMASNNNSNNGGALARTTSIRVCKPSGGGSTVGSLIFGGAADQDKSYLDERKCRRNFNSAANPEQQVLPTSKTVAGDASLYGVPSFSQRERERVAIAPGAVTLDELRQLQKEQQHHPQHHGYQQSRNPIYDDSNNSSSNNQQLVTATRRSSTSDYFANGLGSGDSENQPRRTRRMVAAPGGASNFQLG